MTIGIIGIDCATQPKKIGLASGFYSNGEVCIEEVSVGTNEISIVDTVVKWVALFPKTLITLDAPLGWPQDLGRSLHSHYAGQPVQNEPDQLFHRATDEFIHRELGKKPLEVGANLIARTAHAALKLLYAIREVTEMEIPLAWEPGKISGLQAIEVYPAATLIAHSMNMLGYKAKDGLNARKLFLEKLNSLVQLPADYSLIEKNSDALDAVICVLAGVDFLRSDVYEPLEKEFVAKEGWIWVKKSIIELNS